MKTIFLTILTAVFAIAASKSYAQDIAIKGGANLSQFSYNFEESDNEPDTKFRPGLNIGVEASFTLVSKLFLQTGLSFTQKGTSGDVTSGNNDSAESEGYDRITLNYLEVPVNAGVNITENLKVFAGPYVAIGLGGKEKWDVTTTSNGIETSTEGELTYKPFLGKVSETDLEEDETAYNGLDAGINLGIGYTLGPLGINVAYGKGFSNLMAKPEGGDTEFRDNNKVTNSTLQIYLTFNL